MQLSTKKQAVMLQVLNGNYPEYEITKMDRESLEKFVQQLVKRTSKAFSGDECKFKKPKWWPKDVAFKTELRFPKDSVFYVRPVLKLLVIKCSEYFKKGPFKQKWLPDPACDKFLQKGENDENLYVNVINRGTKRKNGEPICNCPKKLKLNQIKIKCETPPPPSEVSCSFKNPYVLIEPNFVLIPNKNQFLAYFGLNGTNELPNLLSESRPSHLGLLKLANCPQVPFSSDVGRIMTTNENYTMPEELKLRRLEKTEWYLSGKSGFKQNDQEYEVTYLRRNGDECFHEYHFPKRQFCHQNLALYRTPFIWKHLQSAYVKLERMDLVKIQRKLRVYVQRMKFGTSTPMSWKEVKIVVDRTELPDPENNSIRRYSPRLRSL